jgi:hypothetical protein
MAVWSDFHPHALVFVPGCPDPLLEQELRGAAIEFFRRTRAWRQWLDEITTTAGVRQYPIVLPSGSEIVRIEQATADDRPIEVQIHHAQRADPAAVQSSDYALASDDRRTLTILRDVAAGTRLRLQAALMPSLTAAGIPDDLFAQHVDAIVAGARYRLKRMPGPLADGAGAKVALGEFESAIATGALDAWRGDTNNVPRARPKWC